MTQGIGQGKSLIDESFRAAYARFQQLAAGTGERRPVDGQSFGELVKEGIQQVDAEVKKVDRLHLDVLRGEVDFHEAAAQLKQAQLSLEFSMAVRDRFIDAYREVMRMNV